MGKKTKKKERRFSGKFKRKPKGKGVAGKKVKRYGKIVKEAERGHPKIKGFKESGLIYKKVNGRGMYLETDVDKLLDVITKSGRIKASKLARTFKVPRSKIEEWGIILEDHKFIDMHYPPFGEPTLMVRKSKKKTKSKGKG